MSLKPDRLILTGAIDTGRIRHCSQWDFRPTHRLGVSPRVSTEPRVQLTQAQIDASLERRSSLFRRLSHGWEKTADATSASR